MSPKAIGRPSVTTSMRIFLLSLLVCVFAVACGSTDPVAAPLLAAAGEAPSSAGSAGLAVVPDGASGAATIAEAGSAGAIVEPSEAGSAGEPSSAGSAGVTDEPTAAGSAGAPSSPDTAGSGGIGGSGGQPAVEPAPRALWGACDRQAPVPCDDNRAMCDLYWDTIGENPRMICMLVCAGYPSPTPACDQMGGTCGGGPRALCMPHNPYLPAE